MYLRNPTADAITTRPAWPSALAVTLCSLGTIFVGFYPTPVMVQTRLAAEASIDLPLPVMTATPSAITNLPGPR